MGLFALGEDIKDSQKAMEQKSDEPKLSTAFKAIQIALDNYDDIFSDFDTSPYSRRTISDDFLKEIEKRYVENKKGEFEVRLTLPKYLRDLKVEGIIKKRLKDYFILKLKEKETEVNARKRNGFLKGGAGAIALIAIYELSSGAVTPVTTIFSVFGWYALWSGFENLFEVPWKLEDERQLYKKFSMAKYYFISEEALGETEKAFRVSSAKISIEHALTF